MSDDIDLTPEAVERLAAYHDWRDVAAFETAKTLRALSDRLAKVEADVAEWKRQALYHNAEHGKLVVIQRDTEAQLAQAVDALKCAAEDLEDYSPLTGNTIETSASKRVRATLAKITS